MDPTRKPYELVLEFSRAPEAGNSVALQFVEQAYQLRLEGGVFQSAVFPWDQKVVADLEALESPTPKSEAVQRLGDNLRAFLGQLDWGRHEAAIEQALAEGREVQVSIRSGAAELYALPWELLTLKGTGQHLGELAGCTLRYEWPRPKAPSRTAATAEGERILFAWSTAGGEVGANAHLRGLVRACELGEVPFDVRQDVLGNVSLTALAQAMQETREPIAVLHILCHGSRVGQTYGLQWDAPREGGEPDFVDGARLRQVLAPYAGSLRMVVLSACRSGGVGELGSHLGSVAQELHRVGIPAVVASRLPLSVAGSIRMTEVLYEKLLGEPCSLERALGEARKQLRLEGRELDWASLQLFARADEGPDFRPLALRPYRGLLAFEAKHRRFFFGRETLAQALLERVQKAVKGELPRFQVVAGASGSGKSSVVMAGLVPLLPAEEWDALVVRPSELLGEGRASGGRLPSLQGLWTRLRALGFSEPVAGGTGVTEAEVLEEARRLRKRRPGKKLLLVVDQLEEAFTQLTSAEEQSALVQVLWKLAASTEWECVVVSTLRVDHFERCGEVVLDAQKRLDSVVYSEAHRVFVERMSEEELAAAIEKPARAVGLELEAGLVAQLRKDLGQEPGALPLLEYALDLLWKNRVGNRLTHQAYADMKGVTGALTETANQLYASMSKAQQAQARRLLVRLVGSQDMASPQTRRRVLLEEVRPAGEEARKDFEGVLEKLVGSRLLVKGDEERPGEEGSVWVQFAHEALIRRWEQLQKWVKEDWERERQLLEVDTWAKEWEEHQQEKDQGASYLLTGDRLGYARSVRDRYPGELLARSLQLLEASQTAETRRLEQEQQRQERELAVAQKLTRTQQQAASRLKKGLFATAGALLLALGAAALALWQRAEAIEQRKRTERQRLFALDTARVVQASRLREQDPTLAALLLGEVKHPRETPEWRQTAIDVLQRPLSTMVLAGHQAEVWSASFSPDGKWVVTASSDKTARVWSVDGQGTSVVLRGHEDSVTSAAFSPDGERVVTASVDETARVWRTDGKGEPVVLRGHEARVNSVAFSLDGERVVTASEDGTARVWRADGKGEPVVLDGHEARVNSAAFSLDGERVVTASGDGTARVWRADGEDEPVVLDGHENGVTSATFSPNGQWVLTASSSANTVRVWRADGQGEPMVLGEHALGVSAAAFSPDGQRVVTASFDNTARVWRADGQGEPVVLREHLLGVTSAAFSPDGQWVVTASGEGVTRVWRADGKGEPVVLRGHEEQVDFAAFSPDGQRVVTASRDNTARVWKADGKGEPVVLRGHEHSVTSATFSPDGEWVVTASGDGTARVWSVDGQGEPVVLRGHASWVNSAAFSPDGKRVVTASMNMEARIWTVGIAALQDVLNTATSACLSPSQRQRLLPETPEESQSGYEWCERSHRRTPEAAPLKP